MPFMKNGKRDYVRENKLYNSKPKQVKNRTARNKARAMMVKAGKAKKGDGKDIGHIKALSRGGLSEMYNLQVQSQTENRSFSKTKKSKMKSETSKREKSKRK